MAEEFLSDESSSSGSGEDGEKSEAASEDEEDVQSEGADVESEGGDSEGENARDKNKVVLQICISNNQNNFIRHIYHKDGIA